ncbi:male accessory gland serine protease inhibitor [Drosophila erecta]|uniref:BPTI/Kunitz inhibitor domain-containing protein n=1 Tax=Drosophila erecta TaxID=7220 RepID=B3N358_DROER|nr:male accessory gland serine protease inhibitor [Drosophila erecta]EDV57657.1 uncharacterized protein Dere_GG24415 [Drosophila erecta]
MKFIAAVCLMFALLGVTLGLKDPICGLPPAMKGDGIIACYAYFPLFSYYPESNSCELFIYGGCWGNANRFHSKESCEEKCLE